MSEIILRVEHVTAALEATEQFSRCNRQKIFSSSPRTNVSKNFSSADWRRQHV